MNERFDIVERWPELFAPLTSEQRQAVVRALAGGWHEGWTPNREDVADLTEYASGAITFAEFEARSRTKSMRRAEAMTPAEIAAEDARYADLAERAERGELSVKPGTGQESV